MSACLALLPLSWLAWAARFRRTENGRLDALLKASLVFVLLSFAFAEALGLFHALDAAAAACLWALAAVAPFVLPLPPSDALHPANAASPFSPRRLSRPELACLAAAVCIALICLALGLWIPQWSTDAQLYHLPRMEQWIQNQSLNPFPTPYDLQVFFPPGAEYLILPPRLFSGSQALAGLGQWAAFVLSGAAVAAIARDLGGGTRAQVLSVLAWATLPMAVLQSSTAQSDLMAAFGAVLAAHFSLRHDQEPEAGWDLWAAAAIGAALLLKGTDYLFVPAFGLWVALRRDWRKPQALRLALLVLLVAAPNLPFWGRNLALCGAPLGSSPSTHGVAHPDPASLLSNGLKALGDELRVPSRKANAAVVRAVGWIHARLGLPMDDADWVFSTSTPYDSYAPLRAVWNEDCAGDPLQTLALLILLAAAAAMPRRWNRRYLAACLAGALLYPTLVRWNVVNTRLHLPLYACAAPLLGLGLDRLRRPALVWACAALFAAQGLWVACGNARRPLFLLGHSPRKLTGAYDGFFSGYNAALRGRNLGLLVPVRCCPDYGVDEYGVWRGAQATGRAVRIQYLAASPATAPLLAAEPWKGFRPDVIVADASAYQARELPWGGRLWLRLGDDKIWAVYVPETSTAGAP